MGQPRIGDKIFLYGQYLESLEEFEDYNYNSVMGYMTVGGYKVHPVETEIPGASVPGFVVDFRFTPSLTLETAFSTEELIDVTDRMSLTSPLPLGTKIWMPASDFQVGR